MNNYNEAKTRAAKAQVRLDDTGAAFVGGRATLSDLMDAYNARREASRKLVQTPLPKPTDLRAYRFLRLIFGPKGEKRWQ